MRKFFFSSVLLIVFMGSAKSQVYTQKDVDVCNKKFQLAVKEDLSSKPINDIIVDIGKSFIGTDYEAHTLEKEGTEQLVIHLTGLDCTTFLENVLTFAICIKKHKTSFEDYQNELIKIRYRNGKIDSYPSRLHYFSDWIYNNQKKGIVKDITKELGGVQIKFDLNFMSTHPDSYFKLKENPDFITVIKKQEEQISKRTYYYIPKEKVDSIDSEIKSGDLIAITTKIKGLDIGHVGIAVRMDDGKIHLLHAPIPGTRVQISDLPLSEYLSKLRNDSGIIVLIAIQPGKDILPIHPSQIK